MRSAEDPYADIGYAVENQLCLSCGACAAACSKRSIVFRETSGGYLYPVIDYSSCVQCGVCIKVCPGVHYDESVHETYLNGSTSNSIIQAYVGKSLDENVFRNAQSGGVVTGLVKHLLDSKKIDAVLCAGMTYSSPPRGEVLLVNSSDKLYSTQKSKYVPIPLLENIQSYIKDYENIAVVGLPCHLQGLKKLIGQFPMMREKNILQVGLICDRILSAVSIDYLSAKATTKTVSHIIFRDKTKTGYPGNPTVETSDFEVIELDSKDRMEIKDFFTPGRCRLCLDKLNVCADIVCGDPHGLDGIDRQNGETLVLVRSQKGKIALTDTEQILRLRSVDITKAVDGQHIIQRINDWKSYLQSWKDMGKPLPVGGEIFNRLADKRLRKYRNNIKLGLQLDVYHSNKDIFEAVDRWLIEKKIIKSIALPFRVYKKIMFILKKYFGS
jgi:coenzyme F420 hydrogenase subunit beta